MMYLFFIITIIIIVISLIKVKSCREKDTKANLCIQLLTVALISIIYLQSIDQTEMLKEINQRTVDIYDTTVAIGNHVTSLFDEISKFANDIKTSVGSVNEVLSYLETRLAELEKNMATLKNQAVWQIENAIERQTNKLVPNIITWMGD